MMENLDWDRAHTIEEEEEDTPGILEENKAGQIEKTSVLSKTEINPFDQT